MSLVSGDDTRSVVAGNQRIVSQLLSASQARVFLNATVVSLEFVEEAQGNRPGWRPTAVPSPLPASVLFDAVVVATPFGSSSKGLHCVPESATPSGDPTGCGVGHIAERVSKVTTYVSAVQLNTTTFGRNSSVPDAILTTATSGERGVPFYSVAHKASRGHLHLFKVFSALPLTLEQLNHIFVAPTVVRERKWPSVFARLTPTTSWSTQPRFTGKHGLYYLSAIESVTAAMEGSVLSAHNIARLIAADLAAPAPPIDHPATLSWLLSTECPPEGISFALRGFLLGWLVTYSGLGSLSISPSHLLTFLGAHALSLSIPFFLGLPPQFRGEVHWVTAELSGGLVAGLGLSLLRSCSVLHVLLQSPLELRRLTFVLAGGALAFLSVELGFGASLSALVDFAAFASSSFTDSLSWCGLNVQGPVAAAACGVLPPPKLLALMLALAVVFCCRFFVDIKRSLDHRYRWIAIPMVAIASGLAIWEAAAWGSGLNTLSAGGIAEPFRQTLFGSVLATLPVLFGAGLCAFVTGRRNPVADPVPPQHVLVGSFCVCLSFTISSTYSPTFALSQVVTQLCVSAVVQQQTAHARC